MARKRTPPRPPRRRSPVGFPPPRERAADAPGSRFSALVGQLGSVRFWTVAGGVATVVAAVLTVLPDSHEPPPPPVLAAELKIRPPQPGGFKISTTKTNPGFRDDLRVRAGTEVQLGLRALNLGGQVAAQATLHVRLPKGVAFSPGTCRYARAVGDDLQKCGLDIVSAGIVFPEFCRTRVRTSISGFGRRRRQRASCSSCVAQRTAVRRTSRAMCQTSACRVHSAPRPMTLIVLAVLLCCLAGCGGVGDDGRGPPPLHHEAFTPTPMPFQPVSPTPDVSPAETLSDTAELPHVSPIVALEREARTLCANLDRAAVGETRRCACRPRSLFAQCSTRPHASRTVACRRSGTPRSPTIALLLWMGSASQPSRRWSEDRGECGR